MVPHSWLGERGGGASGQVLRRFPLLIVPPCTHAHSVTRKLLCARTRAHPFPLRAPYTFQVQRAAAQPVGRSWGRPEAWAPGSPLGARLLSAGAALGPPPLLPSTCAAAGWVQRRWLLRPQPQPMGWRSVALHPAGKLWRWREGARAAPSAGPRLPLPAPGSGTTSRRAHPQWASAEGASRHGLRAVASAAAPAASASALALA
jgi:hypothetical protein